MPSSTKIAVAVSDVLPAWRRLNVACFLAGGLAGRRPELVGDLYVDADGQEYGPLLAQPVLVFVGAPGDLARTLRAAVSRGLDVSIFTSGLFDTFNDADNRRVVAALPTDALDLAGLAVHGRRRDVDRAVKGLWLHP